MHSPGQRYRQKICSYKKAATWSPVLFGIAHYKLEKIWYQKTVRQNQVSENSRIDIQKKSSFWFCQPIITNFCEIFGSKKSAKINSTLGKTSNFGWFLDLKKKIEKTRFFLFAPAKWVKSQKSVKITFSPAKLRKKWSKNKKFLILHRRFLSKMAIFEGFCIVGRKLSKITLFWIPIKDHYTLSYYEKRPHPNSTTFSAL